MSNCVITFHADNGDGKVIQHVTTIKEGDTQHPYLHLKVGDDVEVTGMGESICDYTVRQIKTGGAGGFIEVQVFLTKKEEFWLKRVLDDVRNKQSCDHLFVGRHGENKPSDYECVHCHAKKNEIFRT